MHIRRHSHFVICTLKFTLRNYLCVVNADVLMSMYKNDSRIFQIADRITLSAPQKLHLTGLQGSASQFILAAVHAHAATAQTNHLVILRDAEEAAYFQNTLENITNALDIFYFPSSFKNKKNYQLLNSSHVMLRTEALTKLTQASALSQNKKVIVTYPEALFEKVVLSKTLSENIISIKQADTLDVNGMLQRFVEHGFERTDFVYEPGQFAIRGGILDIYSFGNEKPYRIELFGNDVDSIRIFDPETQLSERKLLQVSIIPNVETQFESGEKVSLIEFLPENTVCGQRIGSLLKK
jgi:transcription-repair coupling factor (superfamily II helicase)